MWVVRVGGVSTSVQVLGSPEQLYPGSIAQLNEHPSPKKHDVTMSGCVTVDEVSVIAFFPILDNSILASTCRM